MRYKVIHKSDVVAKFETAQDAGDYLFTIPAEKISEFYIHDTKENTAFPYCMYKYEWRNLIGTQHATFCDVLKTLKQEYPRLQFGYYNRTRENFFPEGFEKGWPIKN